MEGSLSLLNVLGGFASFFRLSHALTLGCLLMSSWTLAQTKEMLASMVLTCSVAQTTSATLTYNNCKTNNDTFNGQITVLSSTPLPNVPIDRLDSNNAMWVFDNRADGRPELVLRLYTDQGGVVADLFDRNSALTDIVSACCDETALGEFNPTVRVRAADGWKINNAVNFNFDIMIDGDVYTLFGGTEKLRRRVEAEERIRTDGQVDYLINVRDPDKDGRPDYEYRRAQLPDAVEQKIQTGGRALERTAIMVNEKDDEAPLRSWIPWPHLGPMTYGYLTNSAFRNSYPAIQVDWETGLINVVGEFVRSRGNDNQWFVYAFKELVLGQTNVLDFEAPFSFYNLVDDPGEIPDLSVRIVHTPPFTNSLYTGGYPYPVTNVRYTWKQFDGAQWRRYKFTLLGHQTPTYLEHFNEFDLQLFAPYTKLPHWITNETWGGMAFVVEMNGKPDAPIVGEGVNEWDAVDISRGKFINFFLGTERNRALATQGTQTIKEGYRGEYGLRPDQSLRLYLSPVDRHLHLQGAEGGVWNIDGVSHMRYEDLDKDGYFDLWSLQDRTFEPTLLPTDLPKFTEVLKEQLFTPKDYLIYARQDGVSFRQAQVQPALFHTTAPTDPTSWQQLGAQLGEYLPFRPYELLRAFDRFDGPTMELTGASLEKYQVLGSGGFSFVLTVPETSMAQANGLIAVQPGRNLYTYEVAPEGTTGDGILGSWRVEAVQDPALTATLNAANLRVLEPSTLTLTVNNTGNVGLSANAALYLGREVIQTWNPLALSASTTFSQDIDWTPSADGHLEATLELNGERLSLGTLSVAEVERTQMLQSLRLSVRGIPIALALALALMAGLVLYLTWRLLWTL